jgi:hypothetical protein
MFVTKIQTRITLMLEFFVIQLKPNATYVAKVSPDKNPDTTAISKTDYKGIFWVVAKIPNGKKSGLFKVDIYERNNTYGKAIVSGVDDAPCKRIKSVKDVLRAMGYPADKMSIQIGPLR